uniref:Uncharacterized protein n=1 Tax=Amphimedon queenslandica TaxID=400682 RepID=A0A1X7V5H5_AMPQE
QKLPDMFSFPPSNQRKCPSFNEQSITLVKGFIQRSLSLASRPQNSSGCSKLSLYQAA